MDFINYYSINVTAIFLQIREKSWGPTSMHWVDKYIYIRYVQFMEVVNLFKCATGMYIHICMCVYVEGCE